jgi:ferritin-like metal-binding protein YciE
MAANESLREGLGELLMRELRELYDADRQLLKVFPRLEKAANAEQLANLCREGVEYTEERIARLERVFKSLGATARAKRSFAMAGLIQQAMDTAEEDMANALRDAALLANIQKISHYGIAAYGTARAYARTLELDEAAEILEESLQEKKDADVEMTALAEEEINPRAMESEEEDEMEQEERSGGGQNRGRGSRAASARSQSGSGSRRGGRQQAAEDSESESSSGSRRGRPRKSESGTGSQGGRSQMRGSQGGRSQASGTQSRGSRSQ